MKRIEDIDHHFKINADIPRDYRFFDPRQEPMQLYGLAPNDQGSYCRLPLDFLKECNDGVKVLAWHLAGACVRFSTDARGLAVIWSLKDKGNMPHFTACGQSGLELFEESDEGVFQIKNFIPAMDTGSCGCALNQSAFTPLPGGLRHYVLYFPLYNGLDELMLGFPPDARVEKGRTPRIEKPIVFYGSSITQGGCAAKVGSCYTTLLCRRLDAAQINLGFSGSGRGEENMARYIASLDMSAFVLDYDHNAPTVEHLEKTHERFFSIVREAHPDLPIVMMSKPDFDSDRVGNALRRNVIARTYAHALEKGDKNVWFINGESFFGNHEREICTVDGCHPTSVGFLRMADVVEAVLRPVLYK